MRRFLFTAIILTSVVAFSVSCKCKKKACCTKDTELIVETADLIKKVDFEIPAESTYEITKAYVQDSLLLVHVNAPSTNASQHSFDLYWNGMYMRTEPPKVNLVIIHSFEDGATKEDKKENFSLSYRIPDFYETAKNGELIIQLAGYESEIEIK